MIIRGLRRVLSQIADEPQKPASAGDSKLCADSEEAFNESDLPNDVALGQPFHLSFANHVHGLIARDGSDRPVGGSKPQAGGDSLLHESMILLQDIIEVR